MVFRTGTGNGGFYWYKGSDGSQLALLNNAGIFTVAGELRTNGGGAIGYRHVVGNYGVIVYQDGTNYYDLVTNSGDQYGSFNSLRPLSWNLSTGNVTLGHALAVTGATTLTGALQVNSTIGATSSITASGGNVTATTGFVVGTQLRFPDAATWAIYQNGTSACIWTGGDKLTISNTGNITAAGNYYTFAGAAPSLAANQGPCMYGDANWIVAKPGSGNAGFMVYNYAGVNIGQITPNGFVCSAGTTNASSTASSILSTIQLRFKQNSGDEGSSGIIDYGVISANSLSIVGKGTAINSRNVIIYDNLSVQNITATGTGTAINSAGSIYATGQIVSQGANGILQFQNRNGGAFFGFYATSDWGYWWHSTAGNLIQVTGNQMNPSTNNSMYAGNTGNAWAVVDSYSYVNASDRREKRDIEDLPDCQPLLERLKPQRFKWNHGVDQEKTHWGFVAQDVGAVMREAGHEFGGYVADERGEGIAYNELTAVLWKACQEMAARITALEARLA
jgi:hypothetical protein